MAEIVIQRPDWGDAACKWGSEWLRRKVLEKAKQLGYTVKDLYADNAIRSKVLSECEKTDFIYFSGFGHGNYSMFTGQNMEKIFWVGDSNTKKICKGKHFTFLSCMFGRLGAKWMRKIGRAKGVHGYKEEYIFIVDENDFPNSYAKYFFDSHGVVDEELLKGHTHFTAHFACKRKYLEAVFEAPSICARYLLWNRFNKVFYGNWFSRIKTEDTGCWYQS
jgi:hypothetical protein